MAATTRTGTFRRLSDPTMTMSSMTKAALTIRRRRMMMKTTYHWEPVVEASPWWLSPPSRWQ